MTDSIMEVRVDDDEAMVRLGRQLASHCAAVHRIYLHGELGSGKTTLVRGMLQGLGFQGAVRSPTFTLIEPYTIDTRAVFHFDLYRLNDAEELEFIGAREYLEGDGLCLVEWAELGAGFLPAPDVDVIIRKVNDGRVVQLQARSDAGISLVRNLSQKNRVPAA
jgi:tRNA threonylcarbamoyladenosine biosynthesis protein TsaE